MAMIRLKSMAIVLGALGTVVWAAPAFLSARQGPPPSQPKSSPTLKSNSPTSPTLLDGRYGDPLPPGASLRLGTVRFRLDRSIDGITYSPDGQVLAAATSFHWERGLIHIYRLRDKKEVQTIVTPCQPSLGLAFTPDGKRLVAGMSDTSILIWDVAFDLR
jgi:WD40 repeat protein